MNPYEPLINLVLLPPNLMSFELINVGVWFHPRINMRIAFSAEVSGHKVSVGIKTMGYRNNTEMIIYWQSTIGGG